MTTQSKVETLTLSNYRIAWDGCHKIYWCENFTEELDAKANGYDLFLPSELPRIIKESCSLKFVHPWSLAIEHPLDINQFEFNDDED